MSQLVSRMVFGLSTFILIFLASWAVVLTYRDKPEESEKTIELSNWVLIVLLIAIIAEIVVLRNFLLPDGSWNI